MPLGDNPSALDPEGFDRASTIAIADFHAF